MKTPSFSRAEEIFHAALGLPPDQRADYVAHVPDSDAPTRDLVRALLATDARAHRLDEPALTAPHAAVWFDALPDRVGRHRIVRRIGAGGMGVVYEAEQESPRRAVALKVLQHRSSTLRARFQREAEILGRLQHPSIAQIHEAGVGEVEVGGRVVGSAPFLAMELVRGEPLKAAVAGRRLGIEARLELFARVCDGIAAAHALGIVHRDLKPSNVLVVEVHATSEGARGSAPLALAPKILDFGIAHLAGADAHATVPGELLGTLAYMSPEQARGDVAAADARTDVYALGVMLYEVLAGRPPIEVDGLGIAQAVKRIELEEPEPLHRAVPGLSGDVATIVAKALEKNPQRRYRDASELALDLRRCLAHEPIEAQPASTAYVLTKYARRHRAQLLAAAGVVVALVGGLAVGLVRAASERDAAVAAHAAEMSARRDSEAVTSFLEDLLVSANPEHGARDVTVIEALASFAPEISARFAGRPLLEARLRQTFGDTYRALGRYDAAHEQLVRSLALRAGRLPALDPRLLRARLDVAFVDIDRARYAEAELALEELLVELTDAYGPDDRRVAECHAGLGDSRASRGDPQRALEHYAEALRVRRAVHGPGSGGVAYLEAAVAGILLELGRLDEAIPLLERAHEHCAARLGPLHPRTLAALAGLGTAYGYANRIDLALEVFQRAATGLDATLGPAHRQTLGVQSNLATLLAGLGRLGEARARLEAAHAAAALHLGADHTETLGVAHALGRVRLLAGDAGGAEEILCRAAEASRRTQGEASWSASLSAAQWGESLVALGRSAEGVAVLEDAVAALSQQLGPAHERTRWAQGLLARAAGSDPRPGLQASSGH